MKLLLFSDLHGDAQAARSIVEHSSGFDLAIGAGDFANERRGLSECIAILKGMACPAILVAGNNESHQELQAACEVWDEARVLHGSGEELSGVQFFGLGGGVPPTPFGSWSFDLSEGEAALLLGECPRGAVLISHSPPLGVLDVSSRGQSLGSAAVRRAVEEKRPALVVCGHIHASGGRWAEIDGVPVVNAGPRGIEWTLG